MPYLEDDQVRVVVSLLRGKFHEVEETVATYHRRENGEFTVAELKDFGIQPFGIKVVRIGPQMTDLGPTVIRTRSLQLVGIEPMAATFTLQTHAPQSIQQEYQCPEYLRGRQRKKKADRHASGKTG